MTRSLLYVAATLSSLSYQQVQAEKLGTNQITETGYASLQVKGGKYDQNGNLKHDGSAYSGNEIQTFADVDGENDEEDYDEELEPTASSSSDPTASASGSAECDHNECPCGCDAYGDCLIDFDGDGVADIFEDSLEAANNSCDYDPRKVDLYCARKEWYTEDCDNDCFTNYIEYIDATNPFDACDNKLYVTDFIDPVTGDFIPTANNITYAVAEMGDEPMLLDYKGLFPTIYQIYRGHNYISESYTNAFPMVQVCGSGQCGVDLHTNTSKDWTAILTPALDLVEDNTKPMFTVATPDEIMNETSFESPSHKYEWQYYNFINIIYNGNNRSNYNELLRQDVSASNEYLEVYLATNNSAFTNWNTTNDVTTNKTMPMFHLQLVADVHIERTSFSNVTKVLGITNMTDPVEYIDDGTFIAGEILFDQVSFVNIGKHEREDHVEDYVLEELVDGSILDLQRTKQSYIHLNRTTIHKSFAGEGFICLKEGDADTVLYFSDVVIDDNLYYKGVIHLHEVIGRVEVKRTNVTNNLAKYGFLHYIQYGEEADKPNSETTFTMEVVIGDQSKVDEELTANHKHKTHWPVNFKNNIFTAAIFHLLTIDQPAEHAKHISISSLADVRYSTNMAQGILMVESTKNVRQTIVIESLIENFSNANDGLFNIFSTNPNSSFAIYSTNITGNSGCMLGVVNTSTVNFNRVNFLDNVMSAFGCDEFNKPLFDVKGQSTLFQDVTFMDNLGEITDMDRLLSVETENLAFIRTEDFSYDEAVYFGHNPGLERVQFVAKGIAVNPTSIASFNSQVSSPPDCDAVSVVDKNGIQVCLSILGS